MAFDSPIDKNQGSIKISETFLDRALDIIKNNVGESGIKTLELMMKPIADSIRKSNFILHSTGQINWTGTQIEFDGDSVDNHIILRLMLMDEGAPKTVDLYLTGTVGANSATLFNDITLNNQEMIYLELDRDLILNAVSPNPGTLPARLIIGNNVSSTSLTTGARLQKVSLSDTNGMPEMLATESGVTKSQTMNIPLAARLDWTDGITIFQDIWWIPHGIRWPENTKSVLGAVVVKGLETLPSLFVRTFLELQTAITELTPKGGIILVQDNITIPSTISLPPGVSLIARSNLQDGLLSANPTLTVVSGGKITMQSGSKLWNVNIEGSANFGATFTEAMVDITGDNCEVRDCSFKLINATGGKAICIRMNGSNNRVWNSKFRLGATVVFRVGIQFNAGVGNVDTDSIFTT